MDILDIFWRKRKLNTGSFFFLPICLKKKKKKKKSGSVKAAEVFSAAHTGPYWHFTSALAPTTGVTRHIPY